MPKELSLDDLTKDELKIFIKELMLPHLITPRNLAYARYVNMTDKANKGMEAAIKEQLDSKKIGNFAEQQIAYWTADKKWHRWNKAWNKATELWENCCDNPLSMASREK